jgi:hypothetical protein
MQKQPAKAPVYRNRSSHDASLHPSDAFHPIELMNEAIRKGRFPEPDCSNSDKELSGGSCSTPGHRIRFQSDLMQKRADSIDFFEEPAIGSKAASKRFIRNLYLSSTAPRIRRR